MSGRVYLIHFDRKYHHAGHYIGYTSLTIAARLERHRSGHGAKLLQMLNRVGIGYKVVRVWEPGDQTLERKLKKLKNSKSLCPTCTPLCISETKRKVA